MPTVPVYNIEGKQVGSQELSDAVFAVAMKSHVLSSVVEGLRGNARRATAHVKHRGEVRGGGKKPWKQKGTGRARVGSIRSPLWRGGGVIFGPRNDQNYERKINTRLRSSAIRMCLSEKVRSGQLTIVDGFTIPTKKTKAAYTALKALATATGSPFTEKRTILLLDADPTTMQITKNLASVTPMPLDAVNAFTLVRHPYLIATVEGVRKIESRFGKREVSVK